jgi:serine/threonine protein kinase
LPSVARYVVLSPLGRGGSAAVYLAYDPELDRRVALKIIGIDGERQGGALAGACNDEPSEEASLRVATFERARGANEARMLARISHPNVVPIFDVAVDDGRLVIAMEVVVGETLRDWLHGGSPPSISSLLAAMRGLGDAVDKVHQIGLIHRDLKPSNVIVSGQGALVLIDFGIAVATVDSIYRPVHLDHPTIPFEVEGTRGYMSPEQMRGEVLSPASDVFSFCVILYECLAGVRPFVGRDGDDAALLDAIESGRLSVGAKHVPKWIVDCILPGLRARPEERYASVGELFAAIDSASLRRRVRPFWAAACLVFLAFVVYGAWREKRDRSEDFLLSEAQGLQDESLMNAAYRGLLRADRERGEQIWAEVQPHLTRSANELVAALELTSPNAFVEGDMAKRQCLAHYQMRLATLFEILARADRAVANQALGAASSLGSPDRCFGGTQYEVRPLPVDPNERAKVNAARIAAGQVDMLANAGAYEEADALNAKLVVRAQALAYAPLLAEVHVQGGLLNMHWLRAQASRDHFVKAGLFAAMSDDAENAATARAFRFFLEYYLLPESGDPEEALVEAQSTWLRANRPHRAGAEWRRTRGMMRSAQGRAQAGIVDFVGALADEEQVATPDLPMLVTRHSDLGTMYDLAGRTVEAKQQLMRSIDIGTRTLGSQHPILFLPMLNLVVMELAAGRPLEALRWSNRVSASIDIEDTEDLRALWVCSSRLRVALTLGRPDYVFAGAKVCKPPASWEGYVAHFQYTTYVIDYGLLLCKMGHRTSARALFELARSSDGVGLEAQARGLEGEGGAAFLEFAWSIGALEQLSQLLEIEERFVYADLFALALRARVLVSLGRSEEADRLVSVALDRTSRDAAMPVGLGAYAELLLARGQARVARREWQGAREDLLAAAWSIGEAMGSDSPRVAEAYWSMAGIETDATATRMQWLKRGVEVARGGGIWPLAYEDFLRTQVAALERAGESIPPEVREYVQGYSERAGR